MIALISPIDRLAEQSFTFHMVQHVLLLDLVPIGLIGGLTKVLLRPLTRRLLALERALGPLMHPAVAVVLYIVAMWAWHVPAAYDAALRTRRPSTCSSTSSSSASACSTGGSCCRRSARASTRR